jgi:Na+/pantothenate symporter
MGVMVVVFSDTFSYIVAVSFIGGGKLSACENYQPSASH